MKTSMKVILAAMGIAVLASPVMAENWQHARAHARVAPSSSLVLNGAHGAAPSGRFTPATSTDRGPPLVEDCLHVLFPACSAGGN